LKFHFSIRTKLTLWYALVLATVLAFFGFGTYFFTKRTLIKSLDVTLSNEVSWGQQYLQQRADLKKKRKKNTLFPSLKKLDTNKKIDSNSASINLNEWTEADSIWYQIYEYSITNPKNTLLFMRNNKGIVFYRSVNLNENDSLYFPNSQLNELIITSYQTTLGEERRLAYKKDSNGEIWAAYPMQELDSILNDLFEIFLILSPIALIISVVGAWFIAKRSLSPVDEITRTAKQISASNLDQKIPFEHIDDEIGRLIETFNEMISRLRNSFELTRQFSMDASHELRTPLTIMRGEIELALRNTLINDEQRDILLSLLDEVIRMNNIVETLLLLSKSDLQLYKPTLEPLQLNSIIEELYEDSVLLASHKNINVFLESNDETIILGDKVRLRQLYLNILDNAIKYTPNDGKVVISLHSTNGSAIVKVKDSGIGITSTDISKIFNRFYRVDKARSRELGGSGLGLSIVKWITEMHGGTISVESILEQGSTFTVNLPIFNSHH